jgi:hypothetical protein
VPRAGHPVAVVGPLFVPPGPPSPPPPPPPPARPGTRFAFFPRAPGCGEHARKQVSPSSAGPGRESPFPKKERVRPNGSAEQSQTQQNAKSQAVTRELYYANPLLDYAAANHPGMTLRDFIAGEVLGRTKIPVRDRQCIEGAVFEQVEECYQDLARHSCAQDCQSYCYNRDEEAGTRDDGSDGQ